MTSIVKTLKIKSDIRPDTGYIIIDAADFDSRVQVLWTPEPEEVPPNEQKPEDLAEVPSLEQIASDVSLQEKQKPKTKRQTSAVAEESSETEVDAATPKL